jgi:DnaK suppressor protein
MMRTHEQHTARRRAPPAAPPARRKPLSGRSLQRLLRQLDERERELQAKITDERSRVQSEGLSQLENEVGDDVDRAFVKTQVGLERDLIDRCANQLSEIAAMHERIARGEGGVCLDCGEPIDHARLEVNPVASRCTDCQARSELAARIASR